MADGELVECKRCHRQAWRVTTEIEPGTECRHCGDEVSCPHDTLCPECYLTGVCPVCGDPGDGSDAEPEIAPPVCMVCSKPVPTGSSPFPWVCGVCYQAASEAAGQLVSFGPDSATVYVDP